MAMILRLGIGLMTIFAGVAGPPPGLQITDDAGTSNLTDDAGTSNLVTD